MKRLLDILASAVGLLIFFPVLLPVILIVWLQDFHSPFYIASRVGKDGVLFKMVKLRSMTVNADKAGIDSTSGSDPRITPIGTFIRKFKLDEVTQLLNVLLGHMSLVGPRPNVQRETNLYTSEENVLLSVKPGITDISSIVFSDEGDILEFTEDPDLAYNQLIRPWKSRLGLLYIDSMCLLLDIKLIFLTFLAILSREKALVGVNRILVELDAPIEVIKVALRKDELVPTPPPGSTEVVAGR